MSPAPDTMLWAYQPLKKPGEIPAQELTFTERVGFTVVERGGTELH